MIVRPATAEDRDWMVEELRQFAAHAGGKHPLFVESYAREWVPRLIAEHFVRIAQATTGRAGLLVGLVGTHPLNPRIRTLSELFWWVCVRHRASRAALLLMNAFVLWGRAHADMIILSMEATSPIKESALARRGFRLQERAYCLEV